MYAGEVGVPRLLRLCKKYGIIATWFIPGECVMYLSSYVFFMCRVLRTQLEDSQRRWQPFATLDMKCV